MNQDTTAHDVIFDARGTGYCIYDDSLAGFLRELGQLHIRRASCVEPNVLGRWLADMSPSGGPLLGPFALRADALKAEQAWLRQHRNL